jgi:hypothetical protein
LSTMRRCLMTPDQARELDRRLLVAEAEQAAAGWAYLTVDGCVIESEADLERYQQLLETFDKAAAGWESRYYSSSSCLTFGIRGKACGETTRADDALRRMAILHARLDVLNPCGMFGPQWDIRDGAR